MVWLEVDAVDEVILSSNLVCSYVPMAPLLVELSPLSPDSRFEASHFCPPRLHCVPKLSKYCPESTMLGS